jgi:hypothetical protein
MFSVGVTTGELFDELDLAERCGIASIPLREPAQSDVIALPKIPDKERRQREGDPVPVLSFAQTTR